MNQIDSLRPIAQIMLHYHERLDGSGYPNGLSSGNILLEAQIVAVADVVEAVAFHRPYRGQRKSSHRLWLGGVVGSQRAVALIRALAGMAAASPASFGVLVFVDGLASYVSAFARAFRHPLRTGKPGRPRLVPDPGFLLGQVVKAYAKRRLKVVGDRCDGAAHINTAYIERLNATFRSCLAPLARRGRAIARTRATLTAGMYLAGCAYNLCWYHESLRTPAMAAGLTDHRWTIAELLHYRIPMPAWAPPKRRGRPPKPALAPALAVAA